MDQRWWWPELGCYSEGGDKWLDALYIVTVEPKELAKQLGMRKVKADLRSFKTQAPELCSALC